MLLLSAVGFLGLLQCYYEISDLNADLRQKVDQMKTLLKEQTDEKRRAWRVSEKGKN